MAPFVRQRLLFLVQVLAAAAAVSCLVLVGGLLPAPVRITTQVLLLALVAMAAGLAVSLWTGLKRSGEAMTRALEAAASHDLAGPDATAVAPDPQWVEQAVAHHLSDIGQRISQMAQQRDQQKLAARLAQKRGRHFEAVLHGMPDAAIITDAMDRIVLINDAAVRLFNLEAKDYAGQALAECIADRLLCDLLRGAHSLPASKEFEHTVLGHDGRRIFSVVVTPLVESTQDGLAGAIALLHEVTRERTAERMKTEFVANASHELRTPLGGIKAYLEMLMDGEVKDDQTRDRFYGVIQGEVERLGNMVDNILNIARIEAGIVKVSKEHIPLTDIVQEAVETLEPQAASNGITLQAELLPVFFHVNADREMMRRAVFNLVSNALKYTPKGGRVNVRMHVDEVAGQVTLDVSDTGVGIAEQDLSRLFTKFFRVESNKKMAKGTGLGLVLVKEVVEGLHGGRVSVKSAVGKGSTFSMILPLADVPQKAMHA